MWNVQTVFQPEKMNENFTQNNYIGVNVVALQEIRCIDYDKQIRTIYYLSAHLKTDLDSQV